MTTPKKLITYKQAASMLSYNPRTGTFKCVGRLPYSKHRIGETVPGVVEADGYISIGLFGRRFKAHRLAWLLTYREWPKEFLDHVNGTKADNRIINLRPATRFTNAQNQRVHQINSQTGYLGVSFDRGDPQYTNYVVEMRTAIKSDVSKIKAEIADTRRSITKREKAIKRCRFKGDGPNLLVDMLHADIAGRNRGIAAAEDKLLLADEMLKILENYDWEAELMTPQKQMEYMLKVYPR